MKNNNDKKYDRLLNELFIETLLTFCTIVAGFGVIRLVLKGKIAINVSKFIGICMDVSDEVADEIYELYIHNNIEFIAIGIILICFFVSFTFLLKWFGKKYFEQIVSGMDKLLEESDEKIKMVAELDFIEDKLNEVNNRLRKRALEIKMSEQRKNDMVVYLAHDIKTPLTSVIGYLTLIDDEPNLSDDVKAKYVHISLEKAYRLEMLINEFFEITKYNLQNITLKKENINLCYMLVQVSDELYPQMISKKKKIEVSVDEQLEIQGDPEKLARVFNNILKNAINYGRENTLITIKAKRVEENVYIIFENEGGIEKEKLPLIFDKFYRVDESRASETGGSGLGLAISKDIIELHGGTIKAESDGMKTIFTISLPVVYL